MVVYRWNEPAPLPDVAYELVEDARLSQILFRRGVRTPEEARAFLSPSLDQLADPARLPDARVAHAVLRRAVEEGWRIVVFGDYDVDGLAATTMLADAFRALGLVVQPMIPHRINDGYGLQLSDVPAIRAFEPRLVVTVDCGTSSSAALATLRQAGIETVVIDHHTVDGRMPLPSVAFVSPRRPDSTYPFSDLAAAGVAYQVLRLLLGQERTARYLPLVALGTVADVMPLVGENRVLVAEGLRRLARDAPPGLRVLVEEAGLRLDGVRSWHLGFVLGPRINAAGRMDDPMIALQLLLTGDEREARRLARRLSDLNERRQREVEQLLEQAERRLRREPSLPRVLVLADESWNVGLVGLAASRLASRYARPVVVLSRQKDVSRGSVRGVTGFDVSRALAACHDILLEYGGHSGAAGLAIESERIVELQNRLLAFATATLTDETPAPILDLDAELSSSELTLETVDLLAALEPFGHGNPVPRFFMRNVAVDGVRLSRNGRHLLFRVVPGDQPSVAAVWFDGADHLETLQRLKRIDLAFTLRVDTWDGVSQVKLEVLDCCPARPPTSR
jgi:single-stranded-DNA-specific exonuclease